MDEREIRFLAGSELRIGTDSPKIQGYAARFNVWSEDLGWFRETIKPGAFSKTIHEADIRALWNHNADFVLGRNRAGTLTLEEDDLGLAVNIDPPDATWAKDLQESMKRGDINQMSFGFQTIRDEWNYDADPMERTLIECKLFDVSVVTYPAYPQTSANVRAIFGDEQRNYDRLTRLYLKARRGVMFSKADQESAELLRACLPATPETTPAPADGHPGEGTPGPSHLPQAVRRLSVLRKLLTLREVQS